MKILAINVSYHTKGKKNLHKYICGRKIISKCFFFKIPEQKINVNMFWNMAIFF